MDNGFGFIRSYFGFIPSCFGLIPRCFGFARPAALALIVALLSACSCGDPIVAQLAVKDGEVTWTRGAGGSWRDAPVGQGFSVGDAVRTHERATAELLMGERADVRMEPSTILRFLSEQPERSGVRLESGAVEIDSEGVIELTTTFGEFVVEPGALVRVTGNGGDQRLEVVSGRVVFESGEGARRLEEGSSLFVTAGRLVFEDPRDEIDDTTLEEDSTPDAGADDAADEEEDEGDEEEEEEEIGVPNLTESPARAMLDLRARDSGTIHDPGEPPTAVRIQYSEICSDRAYVSVRNRDRREVFGGEAGAVIVKVRPGRNRYSVRCADSRRAGAGGTLVVRRDDGSSRLNPVPPRNTVDTDGRTYEVLYQNALPVLLVRWSESNPSQPVLHLRDARGNERQFPASTSRVELPSGAVAEGTNRLWFVDGTRRSPETTVAVHFDNAAPAASIREPSADQPIDPSSPVHVSGVLLEGFQVSAAGVELPVDRTRRFDGDVRVPQDLDALVVQLWHRRHGVHYYVRRVVR